jgi:hypothetical protein
MKKTLLSIVAASTLALTSCEARVEFNSQQKEQIKVQINEELQKLKNPLEGKEAYELGPAGKYQCHTEDDESCSVPFHNFEVPLGTVYLIRLDSDNSFKKPIKAKKDQYNQFQFDLGSYEVWVENKGYFAPIDKFNAENKEKTTKGIRKLKVYEIKDPKPVEIAPLFLHQQYLILQNQL